MAITGVKPTYFEVLTAAALLIFKETEMRHRRMGDWHGRSPGRHKHCLIPF